MNASEVLAFLPLLIYGIAIAELASQWKRFFRIKQIYVPYTLMTLLLTEIAFYNVFLFARLVGELNMMSYKNYLLYLLPAIIFLITVYSFTPEKEDDTESYFKENMSVFFVMIALFILSHFLFQFDESRIILLGRIFVVVWILLTAYFRKIWMVYCFFGLFLMLFMSR